MLCTDMKPNLFVFVQLVPENYTPLAPITAPIMTPLGAASQNQPVSSGAPQVQCPHTGQAPSSGTLQQLPPAALHSNMEGAPGAPTGDTSHVRRAQTVNVEKAS